MKGISTKIGMAVAIAMVSAGSLFAADGQTLTRDQWMKQIGNAAKSGEALTQTLAQVSPEDRVEFTQMALKAVSRMPVSNEEKGAAFVRTAVACISGKQGDNKKNVIAEVFADVPVEYLPLVTSELAKRFDQELNQMSDEDYAKLASDTLEVCAKRNQSTDDPAVRDSFAALAFIRGAKNKEDLTKQLLAKMPDERTRKLAAEWIPAAVEKNDYSALTAAADVDTAVKPEQTSSKGSSSESGEKGEGGSENAKADATIPSALGSQTLNGILADMNAAQNAKDSGSSESDPDSPKLDTTLADAGDTGDSGLFEFSDSGANFDTSSMGAGMPRVPAQTTVTQETIIRGYQNQIISIITEGVDPYATSTKHRGHKQ